jgi:hypothetical protein
VWIGLGGGADRVVGGRGGARIASAAAVAVAVITARGTTA